MTEALAVDIPALDLIPIEVEYSTYFFIAVICSNVLFRYRVKLRIFGLFEIRRIIKVMSLAIK